RVIKTSVPSLPRLVLRERDVLPDLIDQLREVVKRHPMGSRTLVRALTSEGRNFARTVEGQRWRDLLAESDLIRRGRLIWHACSLDMDASEELEPLPSEWLALSVRAVTTGDLESVLSTLALEESWHGSVGRI